MRPRGVRRCRTNEGRRGGEEGGISTRWRTRARGAEDLGRCDALEEHGRLPPLSRIRPHDPPSAPQVTLCQSARLGPERVGALVKARDEHGVLRGEGVQVVHDRVDGARGGRDEVEDVLAWGERALERVTLPLRGQVRGPVGRWGASGAVHGDMWARERRLALEGPGVCRRAGERRGPSEGTIEGRRRHCAWPSSRTGRCGPGRRSGGTTGGP